jgi:hypothetical protein
MAMRSRQLFFVEKLDDVARDNVFRFLTYDTAAVACCVSRAWNRAFATHARHLWSDLTFDARHLDVPITADVVRGVASKARDDLKRISMPAELLYGANGQAGSASTLVLGLCVVHPALSHVVMHDADERVVRDLLHASSGVACLEVGRLWLAPGEVTNGDALQLLTHPSLRVKHLYLHSSRASVQGQVNGANGMLSAAAVAMHTQSDWLEAVSVVWDTKLPGEEDYMGMHIHHPTPPRAGDDDGGVTAFAAAVAACARLAEVNAPRMLTDEAFSSVTAALATHTNFEAAGVTLAPVDASAYLPAVTEHLLPRLTRLSITGGIDTMMTPGAYGGGAATAGTAYNMAMCELALNLPNNALNLRHLVITAGGAMSLDTCRDLFTGVAASATITEQELRCATAAQVHALARAGLPAGLTSLSVHSGSASPAGYELARALVALLDASAHVTALSFTDWQWGRDEFWALADFLASRKCGLRRLTLTNVEATNAQEPSATNWNPVASALWVNASLEELTVTPVHDACVHVLSDGLRRSRSLRAFTAGVSLAHGALWAAPSGPNWLGPFGMDALADGFRHNSSLRSLHVVASTVASVHDMYRARDFLRQTRDKRAARGRGGPHDEVHVLWAGAS